MSDNPLSQYFRQPGAYVKLPTQGLWYQDGSVQLTAEGEVAVYSGTDPASASTWSLQGDKHQQARHRSGSGKHPTRLDVAHSPRSVCSAERAR